MPRPRLDINQLSKVPTYRQIADQMREWIGSGEVAGGDRIWSVNDIRQETGVAVMTARKALLLLEAEGLVVVVQGRGTFVAPPET